MPYLLRRLLQLVPVLLGVLVVTFALVHAIPGDPARAALGGAARESTVQALHEKWRLDDPTLVQFVSYAGRLAHGDLGDSQYFDYPVTSLIRERLPATLLLMAYACLLSVLVAVPLAIWAASKRGGAVDNTVRVVPLVGIGLPGFWVGIVLIQLFAIRFQIFPVGGYAEGVGGRLHSLFLPALTIAIGLIPILVRGLRQSMISVLDADYVATAQAKGLSRRRVLFRHGFRNALIPVITLLGLNIAFLVGGAVVIESVFAVPGIGNLMIRGVLQRDFPVVQGVTLCVTLMVIVVSLATDLVHARLDPRVRLS